ncbi:hypothetical protein BDY19DRAFT_988387 [Irpex rosettiformis]|uniref:Uncharacterized protein n=1 Tax=Irpex rosettiformis TaxID=378272 RepID=A0ACB8UJQ6_9APHY|nr:hypothetical protein BDY19DRAFT_988387 [Irpex rosettiformis]
MVQFTDLPTDVVDTILTSLPDFRTLSAAIKVSKVYTYAVFNSHRQTILTSVALNLVGPSLPHALKVVHCRDQPDEIINLKHDESMEASKAFLTSLTYRQRRFVEKSSSAVQKLEDVFSQIYKDRRSPTSVLTNAESLRLRTALYRIWLFCIFIEQWNNDDDDGDENEDDDGNENPWARWNANWDAVVAWLAEYDTPDLLDVVAVAPFLQEVLRRIMNSDPENVGAVYGQCSSVHSSEDGVPQSYLPTEFPMQSNPIHNPGLVYDLLRDQRRWKELIEGSEVSAAMFKIALEKVCVAKNLNAETTLAVAPLRFINEVHGADDKCFNCDEVRGMDLYGPPNWHFLGGVMSATPITQNLPGLLLRSPIEISVISNNFFNRDDFDWGAFTVEIFDFEMPVPEEVVWDKEQWYCQTCITKLFTTRFPWWWMARPKSEHAPAKENCWYGWNCRTQLHRPGHALKLNHFCEPTRDDGKSPEQAWAQVQDSDA